MHCLYTRSQISKAGSVICGLLNSFIYNWRITALQCRVGFCHTSAWISHRYTYVLSLLSSLFYRWGNWSSWRLRDLSKPMLPLHYRAGMWTQVCLAPRCYLTPERELRWKKRRGTQGPCDGAQRYKDELGVPPNPLAPETLSLADRMLLKLDVCASRYEGSFILPVSQWSTYINKLKCGPQAETMMIQQQQICFSKNFLDRNLCTDPEESFTVVENLPANVGDTEDAGLIPRPGRPPEEERTSCCSILAWEIPWKEEPGAVPSMGLHRVRQDWATEHTCPVLASPWNTLQRPAKTIPDTSLIQGQPGGRDEDEFWFCH